MDEYKKSKKQSNSPWNKSGNGLPGEGIVKLVNFESAVETLWLRTKQKRWLVLVS